jgi:TRAP-type uncharacterized transport system substrate-binding protein
MLSGVAYATPAAAPEDSTDIVIADDSSSGTYRKMLGEIISYCSNDKFNIVPAKDVTGGAVGNLGALANNKAQAAFLHSDVFIAHVTSDPTYKRFQTLISLHPEPIHVVALKQPKMRKSILSGKVEVSSLADLKDDTPIGAAGGGVFTANILKGSGDGKFSVVAYQDGKEVLAALENGDIAAAVFVGASPLPNIVSLDKTKFKLVPVGDAIANKVKGIYRPITINYPGLSEGPVATIAPVATILTRKYATKKKIDAQRHLRTCFYEHLNELKDSGSPNWQLVDPADKGTLDWYEIPQ